MRILLAVLFLFWGWLSFPPSVFALTLSEVHPNPLSGPEWVEIYNQTQTPITLSDWWLEDQLSSPSIIFRFSADLILAPQTYYVANLPSSKLNNTADGVTLKDPTGSVIDTMSYLATEPGKSWSRTLTDATYFLADPSPGQSNPTPMPSPDPTPSPSPTTDPTPSPTDQPTPTPQPSPTPKPTPSPSPPFTPPAIIPQPTEIMACPDKNQNEWVELYNASDQPVTLTNWHVIDEAHNSRLASATIPAHSYQIIDWPSAMLNNTGDTFSLVEPDLRVAWTVTYDACATGESFIIQNQDWVISSAPTPNQANPSVTIGTDESPPESPSPLPSLDPLVLASTSASITSQATASAQTISATKNLTPHNLNLDALVAHPFATPSAIIDVRQSTPDLPAYLGVIMGSALLLVVNVSEIYYYFVHAKKITHPAFSVSGPPASSHPNHLFP